MTLEALLDPGGAVLTGEAVPTWLEHYLRWTFHTDGALPTVLLHLLAQACLVITYCISHYGIY